MFLPLQKENTRTLARKDSMASRLGNLTETPVSRCDLLGGWRDVMEDVRHLAAQLRSTPTTCDCGHMASSDGRCPCCKDRRSHSECGDCASRVNALAATVSTLRRRYASIPAGPQHDSSTARTSNRTSTFGVGSKTSLYRRNYIPPVCDRCGRIRTRLPVLAHDRRSERRRRFASRNLGAGATARAGRQALGRAWTGIDTRRCSRAAQIQAPCICRVAISRQQTFDSAAQIFMNLLVNRRLSRGAGLPEAGYEWRFRLQVPEVPRSCHDAPSRFCRRWRVPGPCHAAWW